MGAGDSRLSMAQSRFRPSRPSPDDGLNARILRRQVASCGRMTRSRTRPPHGCRYRALSASAPLLAPQNCVPEYRHPATAPDGWLSAAPGPMAIALVTASATQTARARGSTHEVSPRARGRWPRSPTPRFRGTAGRRSPHRPCGSPSRRSRRRPTTTAMCGVLARHIRHCSMTRRLTAPCALVSQMTPRLSGASDAHRRHRERMSASCQ